MVKKLGALILLLGVLALAVACGDDDAESQPVTISFGHPFPPTHPVHVGAMEPWAEAINSATDGTVTIEFFPSRALTPADMTYQNTAQGGQGIGWALQGYAVGQFPVTEVMELPFVFDSAAEATDVLWTLYEEFEALSDEYADVKLLGLWTNDPGDIWLAGDSASAAPDLSGLTLRAPTEVQRLVISELGGNPVNLSVLEVRDALEQGEIDGLMIANSGMNSYDLYDTIQSGVQCNCYVSAHFLAMNIDVWNGLSESQQAAIEELSGRAISDAAAAAYDAAYDSVAQRSPEAGINKIKLSDIQLAEWREATQSVVDEWIAEHSNSDYPERFGAADLYNRMLEIASG